ncbi:MAG: hypothetical protein H0T45_18750 [Pyrinomonadaceae bacterium]|nr:hypothetical protein [Pyrinomonadaceae bacterium]
MPELRLVVLATQERLVYAANFETALTQLLGEPTRETSQLAEGDSSASAANDGEAAAPQSSNELITRAAQSLTDYQRLTAEGKLGEAGQKLDELKRHLGELQRRQK